MIDILMATYNGEQYIEDQILSIINQTYVKWNLLISDDCSSDNSIDVIGKYVNYDDRINLVSTSKKYGSAVLNFYELMTISQSQYSMFCDQDDVWLPDKIEKSIDAMHVLEKRYGADIPLLVFSDMIVVDRNLDIISGSFCEYSLYGNCDYRFNRLLSQNVGSGCTMLFNDKARELAMRAVNINDIYYHDWWLMLVVSALGHIYRIDEGLLLYRQHELNSVGAEKSSFFTKLKSNNYRLLEQLNILIQLCNFVMSFGEIMPSDKLKLSLEYIDSYVNEDFIHAFLFFLNTGSFRVSFRRKIGQIVTLIKIQKLMTVCD